jgi:predicted  nucleic acid-binding Zn-ribbon protein
MAQLRADRAKQVKALKTQWRKKALKYNHHPEPTKKKYGSAHLKKVKAQIRKINAKAKALERTAAKYKTKYERTAKTFDESRVRNDGDSKEQNSKIGTLMKKLARANRETATVSKILDKFD